MIVSQFPGRIRQFIEIFLQKDWSVFWNRYLLPRWFPLLLGVGLAVMLARFVVEGAWHFVGLILVAIPIAIVFFNYPFVAIIVWVFLTPFFIITIGPAYRIIFWTLHRAIVPAALILVILSRQFGSASKRQQFWSFGWTDLAMVGFLGLVSVNILLLSPQLYRSYYLFFDRLVIPFCVYWLVRLLAPGEKDLKRLVWAALLILIVECIVGLISWFAPYLLPQQWSGYMVGHRTVGTFREPAEYTILIMFSSYLVFQWAMHHKPGLARAFFLTAFSFGGVMIWFSFSRGSWLGGIVAAVGLLLLYPKPVLRMTIIVLIIMSILGGGILADKFAWASERLNKENTAKNRVVLFYASMNMIEEKPFLGWGYENFNRYKNTFIDRSIVKLNTAEASSITSHNTYLTMMVELGLIAFFLYTIPLIWWLRLTLKIFPHLPRGGVQGRSLLVVYWLIILAYIITANFADQRFSFYGVGLWWLTLGLAASYITQHLPSNQPERLSNSRAVARLKI